MGKTENKFDSVKMYCAKKTQCLQRIILLAEILANVKHFSFLALHQSMLLMLR